MSGRVGSRADGEDEAASSGEGEGERERGRRGKAAGATRDGPPPPSPPAVDRNVLAVLSRTVKAVLETLAGATPSFGRATPSWPEGVRTTATGVVGLAGARVGLVAVHATGTSAAKLAARILGAESPSTEETRDALCELANMVAGNLGRHTEGALPPLVSSLPTVIEGENFYLRFVGGVDRTILPVAVGGAELLVELVFDRRRLEELEGGPGKAKAKERTS